MASNSAIGLRPVKTCTECKQSKLRCDSKDRFPNPCSRCQARNLFCTVDATFKRTPARKRLEAMSKELQELRSQREGDHPSSSTGTVPDSSCSPMAEDGHDNFELNMVSVGLKDVFIDTSTATEAFRTFASVFRPQLPIIGSLSISQVHRSQPFLFWTIIVIVATHLPGLDYAELLQRLQAPYMRMLQEHIVDAPLPLSTIQALLILCHWPLPCEMQTRDPSWLYCGTIIQAARFMSLDRQQTIPSLRSLGVTSGSIQARINTWLGCFYVSTSLSLHLGLPPPIDSDLDFASIYAFLKRQTVPPVFAIQVRVQLVVAKYTSLLNHNAGDSGCSSFLRLLDTELDELKTEASLEDDQTRPIELDILSARMHLYALVITKFTQNSSSRQIMLRTALDVALRIIHISTLEFRSSSVDRRDISLIGKQRCLPKNHYRGLAFATIFLLRFFYRNGAESLEEKQSVANHIAMAQDCFKACAGDPLDEYSRTAKIFEVLGRESGNSDASRLRLTHRMGVSIVLDAVSNASEVRGKPVDIQDDETVDEGPPDVGGDQEPRDPEMLFDEPFTLDQINSSFWNDPFHSLLNLENTSFDTEYQDHWRM